MFHRIKEYKLYIMIGAVFLGMIGYFLFSQLNEPVSEVNHQWMSEEEEVVFNEDDGDELDEEKEEEIIVDVKGEVHKPGVYKAEAGERVIDIIERAGGLKGTAEEGAVNLAQRVTDEMVLYIPKKGENVEQIENMMTAQSGGSSRDGKVNINKASSSELETLPGIGPAKAQAIIDYREQNGSFKVVEDLMSVSGIGEKTFEKLKDHITVQ